MKKGLHIKDDFFINLENVTTWGFHQETIQITFVGPEVADNISIVVEGKETPGHLSFPNYSVPINELHRIKREISVYMGTDV